MISGTISPNAINIHRMRPLYNRVKLEEYSPIGPNHCTFGLCRSCILQAIITHVSSLERAHFGLNFFRKSLIYISLLLSLMHFSGLDDVP